MTSVKRVLILGGTGFIGSALAARLAPGVAVRSVSRRAPTGEPVLGVEHVALDVAEIDRRPEVLADVDVAVYLTHSLGQRSFQEADERGAAAFARAAAAAPGLDRIVFLGTIGPTGASPHLRSRHAVGDILRTAGPPVVELRVGSVVGRAGVPITTVRRLVEHRPVVPVPPFAARRMEVITVDACVEAITRAIRGEHVGLLDVTGRSMTYEQAWRRYAAARGLRRWYLPLPWAPVRLSMAIACLLDPANAAALRAVAPSLGHDLVADRASPTTLVVDDVEDPFGWAVGAHGASVGRALGAGCEVPGDDWIDVLTSAGAPGRSTPVRWPGVRLVASPATTVTHGSSRFGDAWLAGGDGPVTAVFRPRGVLGLVWWRLTRPTLRRRLARASVRPA